MFYDNESFKIFETYQTRNPRPVKDLQNNKRKVSKKSLMKFRKSFQNLPSRIPTFRTYKKKGKLVK